MTYFSFLFLFVDFFFFLYPKFDFCAKFDSIVSFAYI